MSEYWYAGIAMVFWGLAPIFGKLGLSDLQPLAALTLRSLVISLILAAAVTVRGEWGSVAGATGRDVFYIGLEGICAALLGQLAYYYALKYGEVSRVSPLVSAFPLVALALGIAVLGEKLTIYKVVAGLLIFSGIVMLKY
jgi:transporter family protein